MYSELRRNVMQKVTSSSLWVDVTKWGRCLSGRQSGSSGGGGGGGVPLALVGRGLVYGIMPYLKTNLKRLTTSSTKYSGRHRNTSG